MKHAVLGVLLLAALSGCEHHRRVAQWPTPGQSAIERALAATVLVETPRGGMCAGYWADARTVVTAAHCADPDAVSHVTSPGMPPFPAEVVYYDDAQDLALLHPLLTLEHGHEWLLTARIDPLAGDPVYLVGHPAGYEYSIAAGNVAHPRREVDVDEWGVDGVFVQVNAGIWFGNSGGPAIDLSGEVVGICSFFVADPALGFLVHYEAIESALTSR